MNGDTDPSIDTPYPILDMINLLFLLGVTGC